MNYIQLQMRNYIELCHEVMTEKLSNDERTAILNKLDILKEIIRLHGYKLGSPRVAAPMTPYFIPII